MGRAANHTHHQPIQSNVQQSYIAILSRILSIRCRFYSSMAYNGRPYSLYIMTQFWHVSNVKTGWPVCPVKAHKCATAQGTYSLDIIDIICEYKTPKLPRYPLRVCMIKKKNTIMRGNLQHSSHDNWYTWSQPTEKKFQKTHKPRSYNMSTSPAEEKKKVKRKETQTSPPSYTIPG